MLIIPCPYCGEAREEEEFTYAGQAHMKRPSDPSSCTDEEWGRYLFFRQNPRGLHAELWYHASGCRRHFNVIRDTTTYRIRASYRLGEAPPPDGAVQ